MNLSSLAQIVLPANILDHFELIRVEELYSISDKKGEIHIWLDELNILPEKYTYEYESKGFRAYKLIQDFPIRGKAVFLHCRRRVWRHKYKIESDLKSDFTFIGKGTKLTRELVDFLKG